MPTTSTGVGNSPRSGSSYSTTPGAVAQDLAARASARPRAGRPACTATECVVITARGRRWRRPAASGRPRILRDSLRILSSSEDQPRPCSEPAHGTTLSASGAGNGPRSPTAPRTSPGPLAERRSPATLVDLVVAACRCPPARRRRPPGRTRRPARRARTARCSAPTRDDHRQRGAVGVGDDALGPPQRVVRVDLGHHQRHLGVHPEGAGVVHARPRRAPRRSAPTAADTSSGTSNMATSTPVEGLLGQRDDLDLLAAHASAAVPRSGARRSAGSRPRRSPWWRAGRA